MPKILTIDKCFMCWDCVQMTGYNFVCKRRNESITNPEEIPSWCPLPDACKHKDVLWSNNYRWCEDCGEDVTEESLPDAEEQCDHTAPEGGHYCEKCGDFLGC